MKSFDGIRSCWNAKNTSLYPLNDGYLLYSIIGNIRYHPLGNKISIPPAILHSFPQNENLDGELWYTDIFFLFALLTITYATKVWKRSK